MALETTKLNPRIVLAVASTLCATSMAQDTPAKPPEAPAPAAEKPATAAALKAADAAAPAADEGKPKLPAQAVPAPAELDTMSLLGKDRATSNVTINLINRMVKKGLLDKEEAADLIAQSEQDVVIARNQVRDDAQIATQMVIQEAVTRKVIPNLDPMFDDALRVTYIPETVKKQIKDDLRAELAAEAKTQGAALPKGLPEWITRFRVKGDIRIRSEFDSFPAGNDNTGAFPNFNAINTGQPFDIAGTVFSPQLNVDQDRTRFRLRMRMSAEVDMGEGWTAGVRFATGQNNSPVSVNQTIGLANQAQGGNFSKYAIWLERAFLKYELGEDPNRHLTALLGRFENPFFGAGDVMWDDDLGFDGIALSGRYQIAKGITPFGTVGAFPVFNTDFNFASNSPAKFKSVDRYLYGGQLGVEFKPKDHLDVKIAVGYFHFDGVEGRKSTPFTPLSILDQGDTDETRPSFAQKGNTYMALRDIIPDASNNFGTINQWQYFGLASKFRPLVFSGRLDYSGFEPVQISLIGDYIKNLGWNRAAIESKAVNNRGTVTAANPNGSYQGGDTAWMVALRAGKPVFEKRGDWQAGVNYRHVESDAVVDGFNDSVFGFGGTNMKGFTLFGSYATSARTSISMRWMSASEIAGPPLKSDIFMIDFGGKF